MHPISAILRTIRRGPWRVRYLVRLSIAVYLFILSFGGLGGSDRPTTPSALEGFLDSFKRQPSKEHPHERRHVSSSSSSSSVSPFGEEWVPGPNEVDPETYNLDDDVHFGDDPDACSTRGIFHHRAYERVPGYRAGCGDSSFYGYVMRDVSGRILAARRDQSPADVLIVPSSTSNCNNGSQYYDEITKRAAADGISARQMIKEAGYDIGDSFFVEAALQGHRVVTVGSEVTTVGRVANTTDQHNHTQSKVLLAVFDPDPEQEDDAVLKGSPYVQSGSIQYAIFRISSTADAHFGLAACDTFWKAGYRLQVLSSSHVSRTGLNDYGPNTLLKNARQLDGFLDHGARLAIEAEDGKRSVDGTDRATAASKPKFRSFLFATRGLELAIPSRKEFLNLTGFGDDDVIDVKSGVPYRTCPSSEARIEFEGSDHLQVSCFGRRIPESPMGQWKDADVWYSHATIASSEVACLRCKGPSPANNRRLHNIDHVGCTTRLLENEALPTAISRKDETGNGKPNLVLVELKGVNQIMLNLSLPAFRAIAQSTGLVFFPNYVGLKNQHHPRTGQGMSRDLAEQGYRVFQASNRCLNPSNNSTDDDSYYSYGSQLQRMFCFDYDRPNCLGDKHTASYLFEHATQFIDDRRKRGERWASLLTLVDGQEETETVVGTLDSSLALFFSKLGSDMSAEERLNTVIAVFSDDVKTPVLYMRAGAHLASNSAMFVSPLDLHRTVYYLSHNEGIPLGGELLVEPLPSYRATCDYLQTTINAICDDTKMNPPDKYGAEPTPPSVLSFYADIPRSHKLQLGINRIRDMPERAKVTRGCHCSTNLQTWYPCDTHPWESSINFREYFILVDCPKRPTHLEIRMIRNTVLTKRSATKRAESGSTGRPNVNILFLEIDSASVEYADRHFPNTRELLRKYRIHQNGKAGYDCVSGLCSADFSFTSLAGANSIPNQVAALSGCVSSSTDKLCGLTNQDVGEVCNDPNDQHDGLRLERVRVAANQAYWCPNRSVEELKTPWLFGVTDSQGYINFFGEEFCYDRSPYVTQGNVFSRFYQDIEVHHVFCRLAERQILKQNLTVSTELLWGMGNHSEPCFDGFNCGFSTEKAAVSLQFIEQMWDTYADRPKFAFLNAMAAHVYDHQWEKLPLLAEAYDLHLSRFLESMLSRKDSSSTLIVVRSDHGLQRGPMAMDYAQQVEHRHPWTEIIVPENLISSKSAFFQNQRRLSTGFDLYTTLRSVADPKSTANRAGIPGWSFNMIATEIPINRTCEEAMVDPELCRRLKPSREYGVCNVLDVKQVQFCAEDMKDL